MAVQDSFVDQKPDVQALHLHIKSRFPNFPFEPDHSYFIKSYEQKREITFSENAARVYSSSAAHQLCHQKGALEQSCASSDRRIHSNCKYKYNVDQKPAPSTEVIDESCAVDGNIEEIKIEQSESSLQTVIKLEEESCIAELQAKVETFSTVTRAEEDQGTEDVKDRKEEIKEEPMESLDGQLQLVREESSKGRKPTSLSRRRGHMALLGPKRRLKKRKKDPSTSSKQRGSDITTQNSYNSNSSTSGPAQKSPVARYVETDRQLRPKRKDPICVLCFEKCGATCTFCMDVNLPFKFTCCLCNKSCQRFGALVGHLKSHLEVKLHISRGDTFPCDACSNTFDTYGKLDWHVKTVHLVFAPFSCPVCKENFKTKGLLDWHRIEHVKPIRRSYGGGGEVGDAGLEENATYRDHFGKKSRPLSIDGFSRDVCKESFKTKGLLNWHEIESVKPIQWPFQCQACNVVFKEVGLLKLHIACTHSVQNHLSCNICDKSFTSPAELENHMRLRLHSPVKPFKQFLCDKGFPRSSPLYAHKKQHSLVKSYKCDVCQKKFASSSSLKAHTLIHLGIKPYKCPDCGRGFSQISSLNTHKLTHTGERPYLCEICSKTCTTKQTFISHHNTHLAVKPYICDVCGKGFAQTIGLKRHAERHLPIKLYLCDVCGKEFTWKNSLRLHKITHWAVKPHPCDVCNKSFTQKGSLKLHKKTHLLVKPYVCNVCCEGFTQRTRLKLHEKIHMTIKPFRCDVCKKSFSEKESFIDHKATHNDKGFTKKSESERHTKIYAQQISFSCEICNKRFRKFETVINHLETHAKP